eukprot:COSAG02_NODE_36692_length_451_cov_2.036932_1_plen_27_part_01
MIDIHGLLVVGHAPHVQRYILHTYAIW